MSRDDWVMCFVMAICAGVAMILICAGMVTGRWPPAFPIAVLIGTAVATLTFRYLGGTAPTTFSLGALKLSGSAALLVGVTYFGNQELNKQIPQAQAGNEASTSLSELKGKVERLTTENQKLKTQTDDEALLKRLLKEDPQTPFARQLRDMVDNDQGVFRQTSKTLTSVIKMRNGSYQACRNLGLERRPIRVSVPQSDSGSTTSIRLESEGLIDPQFCQDEKSFKLQISCDAGQSLFPDDLFCDPSSTPKWKTPKAFKTITIRPIADQ